MRALLERHQQFAHQHTPPEDVHALGVEGLLDPAVTLYALWTDGEVVAIGAVKGLDEHHLEIKSMHTAEEARGRGVGAAMLEHLLSVARERGAARVSLETGSGPAFAAARGLYSRAGCEECGPFGGYPRERGNTFMTKMLEPEGS